MPDRALVIAIEHYGHVAGHFVEQKLQGALNSALEFRDWLEEKWRRATAQPTRRPISVRSPSNRPARRQPSRHPATRCYGSNRMARTRPTNATCYYSGHGFRLAKPGSRCPIWWWPPTSRRPAVQRLLPQAGCADRRLARHPRAGCHYYFIDACRNEVTKAIAGSLMPFESDGDEEPSWFVLQSTVAGSPALVGGPFAATLRDGLNGAGKAKVWDPPIVDSMKVRFDSLRRYVTEAVKGSQPITQKSGGEKGESDVVLATIKPVEPSIVTITLADTPEVVNGQGHGHVVRRRADRPRHHGPD